MASGVGRTPEERYEHAMEYVKLVGLEDYADLSPVELSTGMKQRLGLARVLASQAEVLLMDEPFASLDFLTRAELQHQVLQLQQKLPRTILLSRTSSMRRCCSGSRSPSCIRWERPKPLTFRTFPIRAI